MAVTEAARGIQTTVEFPGPVPCPIATVSRETDATIQNVWTSVRPDGPTPSMSELLVTADEPPAVDGVHHVISLGHRHLLRFPHGAETACPCACLGKHGCVVQQYVARSGTLRLVFNATDFEELQAVMRELQDRFADLDVRRLVRDPDPERAEQAVYVDRGKLTDRQLEVLRTAYRMGYFDRVRESNATEIAAELDIDPSTFTEHLKTAQRKLLADVLAEDGR